MTEKVQTNIIQDNITNFAAYWKKYNFAEKLVMSSTGQGVINSIQWLCEDGIDGNFDTEAVCNRVSIALRMILYPTPYLCTGLTKNGISEGENRFTQKERAYMCQLSAEEYGRIPQASKDKRMTKLGEFFQINIRCMKRAGFLLFQHSTGEWMKEAKESFFKMWGSSNGVVVSPSPKMPDATVRIYSTETNIWLNEVAKSKALPIKNSSKTGFYLLFSSSFVSTYNIRRATASTISTREGIRDVTSV